MATEKECFEMGIQAAYNAQAAGYEIITMRKGDGIFDGDYEYAVKVLGEGWDEHPGNREAFMNGWNSMATEMICDKCGASGGLYYQGASEHGNRGICNACMINKMISDNGELIDQPDDMDVIVYGPEGCGKSKAIL